MTILSTFDLTCLSLRDVGKMVFYMDILFKNNLMQRLIMQRALLWRPLLLLLVELLSSNLILHPTFIRAIDLVLGTRGYWRREHLQFLIDMHFEKAIRNAFERAYWSNTKQRDDKVLDIAVISTFIFHIVSKEADLPELWDHYLHLFVMALCTRGKKCKCGCLHSKQLCQYHWKVSICKVNLMAAVRIENPRTSFFGPEKSTNECALTGCSRNCQHICKGCKLVYYCSRNHQKKDWKIIHSTQCAGRRRRAIML